jgi:hypothetical protein
MRTVLAATNYEIATPLFIQRIQFLETMISAGADSSAPFFVTTSNNQKRHRR